MKTDKVYGIRPFDLGKIDLDVKEMMFWQYCPVKLLDHFNFIVPDNLQQFQPILDAVREDFLMYQDELEWYENYVYLTAKRMWSTQENPGNRPGWHSDGFLTDDLNYIWYDGNPTIFYFEPGKLFSFTKDHNLSLPEMDAVCEGNKHNYVTYPNKTLLCLTENVLHKVDTNIEPGFRTFVKVSVSKDKYNLEGNSINHVLNPDWKYIKRNETRNNPSGDS